MDSFLNYFTLTEIGLILAVVPFLFIGTVLLVARLNVLYRKSRIPEFHRKRVFITGTDTGFGRELVLKLDRKDLIVYAGCYTKEGGQKLKEITSDNVRILDIDVTKRETLEQARDFIEKDLPPGEGLWGLVNNAGIISGVILDFCSEQDFRDTMEVNFYGVLRTVEIFGPLVKRARGRIVNLGSVMGQCSVGTETYTGSKHALKVYNHGLRRSMKTFGVHVAILEPGFYPTNITAEGLWPSEIDRTWNRLPQHIKEEYGEEFRDEVKKHMAEFNCSLRKAVASTNKLSDVPNAITHALSSTRPKDVYTLGLDAFLLVWLYTFTPNWIMDIALRYTMKYNKVAKRRS